MYLLFNLCMLHCYGYFNIFYQMTSSTKDKVIYVTWFAINTMLLLST